MNNVKTILKSRTFWGGLLFAVANYAESMNLIPAGAIKIIEAAAVGLGLYGARNVIDPKDKPAA